MNVYFVYITTSGAEESHKIAHAVVSERLAACANQLDGMASTYWWGGEVVEEREGVVIVKTAEDRLATLRRRVCELHSYELPCVVALPIADVSADYRQWIIDETRDKPVVGTGSH